MLFLCSSADQACILQLFGNCTQFCVQEVTSDYGYLCTCAEGYSLQLDGLTCLAFGTLSYSHRNANPFVLIAVHIVLITLNSIIKVRFVVVN